MSGRKLLFATHVRTVCGPVRTAGRTTACGQVAAFPLTGPGDAIIFSYGPVLLSQAYQASRVLSNRGIGLCVVNMPWLNQIDPEWLRDLIEGYQWVFTLDNHYLTGGLGDLILTQLMLLRLKKPPLVKKFGVSTIPACGLNDEVLRAHRLDADSLCEDIQSLMKLQRV